MSVLVYQQLLDRGPSLLDPFDSTMVQPSSIDIRLGTSFRVGRHHSLSHVDLASIPPEDELTEAHEVPLYKRPCEVCEGSGVKPGSMLPTTGVYGLWLAESNECLACEGGFIYDDAGRFVIHPHQAVLASTLECITVPEDLVMTLEGKSSLARLFLIPHVQAGYFDPGWCGVGTLEIVNLNSIPIVLRPGLKICQSRWMTLDEVPECLYGSAEAGSHYQGAVGVDGSRYEG